MSESKLELVLRLTSEEEKQAALMFKAMQDDCTNAEDALNQALSYRVEYEEMSRGARIIKSFLCNLKWRVHFSRT